MDALEIHLEGPGLMGRRVNARVLRTLLGVLVDGSGQAVRIRTQGRSSAPGRAPDWLRAVTEFEVVVDEGSTVLEVRAPSILRAAPDEFSQEELFPEIDTSLSSLDYFVESVSAILSQEGQGEAYLYDRAMLKTFSRLDEVFDRGVSSLEVRDRAEDSGGELRVTKQSMDIFQDLSARIPPPQQVRIAGKLDTIRHSDRTFIVRVPDRGVQVKGLARADHIETLKGLWSEDVVVSGRAHFTAKGEVQRIEAEDVALATDRDLRMWRLPEPVARRGTSLELRERQGPRSGLAAIIGGWPGDETDEEIAAALQEIS